MKIKRYYQLQSHISPGKVLVIYGPRQVGKTTLLQDFLRTTTLKYKLDSGERLPTQQIFSSQNFEDILGYAQGYELIAIDEAQQIPEIGRGLKILIDHMPNIRVIVTGSSSFQLAGQIGEPLTGRKITLTLYPISQMELLQSKNKQELTEQVEDYLMYGSYPEIITSSRNKKTELLTELVNSSLLHDILALEKVKGSKILMDLLRLIAFQIGSEISLNELGSQLGIDTKTVARYLDLFEKSFVLFNLRGYSRNLRSEITKKSKYYFYDTGIRNALISNFNPPNMRDDVGQLWENFIIIERIKKQTYKRIHSNNYFWRTWEQKEVDWIEERMGELFGYEIKFNKTTFVKPKQFFETYPSAHLELVNNKNYLEFIT